MGAFAYPLVVLILGIVAMVMFRRHLGRFLDRAHKLGITGLEASVSPAQQTAIESAAPNLPKTETSSFNEFQREMDQFRFATAVRKMEEFKRQVNIDAFSREELIAMTVQTAGTIMMAVDFENVYKLIFGSQLAFMQDLNTVYGIGRPLPRARAFYDRAAAEFSEVYDKFSFEQWLEFLTVNRLVLLQPDQIVTLTQEGRDFLRYIVQAGKPTIQSY